MIISGRPTISWLLSGEHFAWIFHEKSEQPKLHPGQFYLSTVYRHLIGIKVQGYLTDSQQRGRRRGLTPLDQSQKALLKLRPGAL